MTKRESTENEDSIKFGQDSVRILPKCYFYCDGIIEQT